MERPWLRNYDPGIRHTIDYPDTTVDQMLKETARQFPDNTATIFGAPVPLLGRLDARLTYQQLDQLVDRFAAGLQKLGLRKGDRVTLYLPNCPQYLIGYYGALRAGAAVVPCNPLYVARELEHQLSDAGATIILCLSRFYPLVKSIRANTRLQHVIVTSVKEYFTPQLAFVFGLTSEKKDGHRVSITGDPRTYWLQDVLAEAPAQPTAVEIDPQDTACLLYTGGTTGTPKGAQLTHRNVVANTLQTRWWANFPGDGTDVFVAALPLYHSYAMTTAMNHAIAIGAAQILIVNPREMEALLMAIEKHKPTFFPAVPAMYMAINNYPGIEKYDLGSIRLCISGAAGLPVEVQKEFQRLSGGKLVEGYGLTEASPVTHCNPVDSGGRIGTIGLPFPDTDCKIVDLDTGEREVPLGETGELCVRGPQVMKGYWNMPAETANTLRDGWLYTGDVARMDEDGYFQIVDRKKDMIVAAGGLKVYPREVEDVLYEYPKVQEAAVVATPVGTEDERVKAYIVLKPGQSASEEEIVAFCRQNMAPYKVPRFVEFRDSLPKTMVGKVLRRALLEEEEKGAVGES
jgi:long-chain acyl-CoA synthetase